MSNFDLHNINFSSPMVLIGGVLVILLIVTVIAIAANHSKKRSDTLRERFGSEYDLAVREQGARSKAETKLMDRVRHVEQLRIRELMPTERERFMVRWDAVQARFVDHPRGSVTEADELVNAVMQARGFPGGDFERRVEDISVNHARLVDSYRSANTIALRAARNEATTEELRTAMLHYRSLFDELLQVTPASDAVADAPPVREHLRRSA